jgi:uncharacterized repeat protein (TIGR02543 family)
MPSVTDVTVSPSTVSIDKGDSQTFTATLTGSKLEEADQTVTWTVTGGTKAGTAISEDGELTIAADETAETLTVTATSVLDDSKSGTASVTVTEKPEETAYFGTWRSVPYDGYWEQLTISADEIELVNINGVSFTMSGLTWTKIDNPGGDYTEDYPKGYSVTGTLTKYNIRDVPKADGSGYCEVGDIAIQTLYISTDGESIREGNEWTNEHEAFGNPHNKTTDVEYWQVTWDLNGGEWAANDNHATRVAKDGKLAAPNSPTKTDNVFGGWYTGSSLTIRVGFPYDVNSVTENFTLYAKWYAPTDASAILSYSVIPANVLTYNYISVQRQTESGGWSPAYDIPPGAGTGVINVVPGTYRISYMYWTCLTVDCMQSRQTSAFSVSAGETRTVSVVGIAVNIR